MSVISRKRTLVCRLHLYASGSPKLDEKYTLLLYKRAMLISLINNKFKTMRRMSSSIQAAFWLSRWLEHTKRDRIEKSRLCLKKALCLNAREEFIFTKPVEAIQLIGEERHDEALTILREAYEDHKNNSSPDEQYVQNFCEFYECLLTEGGSCDQFVLKASELDCSKSVRNFLKFPT